jgi:hypothetical protein
MNRSTCRLHALLAISIVLILLLMSVSCKKSDPSETIPTRSGDQTRSTPTPSPRSPPSQATIAPMPTSTLPPTASLVASTTATPFPTTPAPTATPSVVPTATPTIPRPDAEVAIDQLNMRSGPGLQHTVIRSYPRGTALEVFGQGPDSEGLPWLFVQAADGRRGWVSARPSLATTQYVIIHLAISSIAAWPTPTALPTSLPPTPFAVIVEILAFEPIGMPTGTPTAIPTGTPVADPTILPPSPPPLLPPPPIPPAPITPSPRPQFVDSVVTISCNLPCLPGNQVNRYALSDDVCLQWHENGNLQAGLITITLIFGPDQISQSFNGYGASICRVARIRPSSAGNYGATLTYGNIGYTVSWVVE